MEGSDRFFCPYPGCQRSFIDLWRLKVHYRADPDVRGSGRERGHGMELPACPKCKATLERGRHHVNCKAGRATPSQNKRTHNQEGITRKRYRPERLSCDYPVDSQSAGRSEEDGSSQNPLAVGSCMGAPWPSGKMTMMPCNIQKGFIFSADANNGVKLISGHAFFLPSKGNAQAYFIPNQAVSAREQN